MISGRGSRYSPGGFVPCPSSTSSLGAHPRRADCTCNFLRRPAANRGGRDRGHRCEHRRRPRPMGRRRSGSDRVREPAAMQAAVDQASAHRPLGRSRRRDSGASPAPVGSTLARAIHQWSSARRQRPIVEVQARWRRPRVRQIRDLFGEDGQPRARSRVRRAARCLIERRGSAERCAPRTLATRGRAAGGSDGRRATCWLTASVEGAECARSRSAASDDRGRPARRTRRKTCSRLAAHFLAELAADGGHRSRLDSPPTRGAGSIEEPWTGNVRELRERIRQAIRLAGQGAISAEVADALDRRRRSALVQGRKARLRDALLRGSAPALRRQHQPRGPHGEEGPQGLLRRDPPNRRRTRDEFRG